MAFSSLTFFSPHFCLICIGLECIMKCSVCKSLFRAMSTVKANGIYQFHRRKKRNHKHRVFFKSFNVEIIITNTGIHLTMIHKQKKLVIYLWFSLFSLSYSFFFSAELSLLLYESRCYSGYVLLRVMPYYFVFIEIDKRMILCYIMTFVQLINGTNLQNRPTLVCASTITPYPIFVSKSKFKIDRKLFPIIWLISISKFRLLLYSFNI